MPRWLIFVSCFKPASIPSASEAVQTSDDVNSPFITAIRPFIQFTTARHGAVTIVAGELALVPRTRERERNLASDLAALRIDRPAESGKPRLGVKFAGAMAAAALILGMLLLRGRGAAPVAAAPPRAVAAPPLPRSPAAVLTASGYLVARRKAVVSAKIQGRLAALFVEEGSPVRRGDVMARLENRDLQAQIDVARAEVQRAGADLAEQQRQRQLSASLEHSGAISSDQLQAAASRVRVAEAVLAQSRASLSLSEANFENTIIRAPFDGVVVKKMAEVGESVAPIPPGVNLSTSSGAIVAIADLSSLEAEVDVSENNIARLRRRQPAQVSVGAFPGRIHPAVVREVIPTADRTKATITVKVTILDRDPDLRPEMSATVTFLNAKESDVRK